MAQVAIRNQSATEWDGPSATPTVNIPAGLEKDRLLLVVTTSNGASVPAALYTGFTLRDSQVLGDNRLSVYTQTLADNATATTISPTYDGAVEGNAWCASINGLMGTPAITFNTSWSHIRGIGSVTGSVNALQLFIQASAHYPRFQPAVSGFTKDLTDYQYVGAGGGLWLSVLSRNVGAGATAGASFNLRNETDAADAGDQTLILNMVAAELPTTGVSEFDVLAEFPSIGLTVTPDQDTVVVGEDATFSHVLQGSASGVTWEIVSGSGSIDGSGTVTTTAAGVVTVKATSVEAPSVTATGSVTVKPAKPTLNPTTDARSPIVFSGTGAAGASLKLLINNTENITTTVDESGNWSVSIELPSGSATSSAYQVQNSIASDPTDTDDFEVLPAAASPYLNSISLVLSAYSANEGETILATVCAFDQYGLLLPGQTSGVRVSDGSSEFVYGPEVTDVNGCVNIPVTIATAGEYTLTSFSGARVSHPVSLSVSELLDAPVKTAVSLSISPVAPSIEDAITATVIVVDQYGRPMLGELASLILSGDDDQTLGPLTMEGAGYLTFTVAALPEGNYSLKATSGAVESTPIVFASVDKAEQASEVVNAAIARASLDRKTAAREAASKPASKPDTPIIDAVAEAADAVFVQGLLEALFNAPPIQAPTLLPIAPPQPKPLSPGTQRAVGMLAKVGQEQVQKAQSQMAAIEKMLS